MNISIMELTPDNGRKSFYGKAKVFSKGNVHVLKSYDTEVCAINAKGEFLRFWNGYSDTTMRHVNAFLHTFGIDGGGKAWWNNQPVKHFDWPAFYLAK
jgi:hypothetical protein